MESGPSQRNVDVDQLLASMEDWTTDRSDPPLSEHTLIALRNGDGWFTTLGAPIAAVVTLAPSASGGSGLVEMAGRDEAATVEAWNTVRDDMATTARSMGMKHVEVIDRLGAVEDGEEIRSVIRMRTDQPDVGSVEGLERFELADIPALVGLVRAVFKGHPENGDWTAADFEQRMNERWFDADGLLISKEAGTVTGFCWTKVHPDAVGEIYLVAVDPGHGGRGLGKALVKAGLGYLASERECREMIVYTEASNDAARKLYGSLGFEVDRIDRRIGLKL